MSTERDLPSEFAAFAPGVDFGKTASDYATHRAGFPPELLDRLAAHSIGLAGQHVLDLGTGTGTLARQFAQRGAVVTGIDPAEAMLEQAAALDAKAGANVTYRLLKAENTGLPGGTFDAVTAGQCWHWFDRPRAAAEVWRLLKPGRYLAICHFDWIPLPGNVVEASERLIEAHNPAWRMGGGLGIHPQWSRDVGAARFTGIETFSFDLDVAYSHEAWRGRIRASAGIAASLTPERVAAFDTEHAAMLAERFPTEPLFALHRCWALVCRKPA